jgi:hypothetical protein
VANLLKRDEDELTGKAGIGSSAYTEFGQEAGDDKMATVEDFPDAFKPAGGELTASFRCRCIGILARLKLNL